MLNIPFELFSYFQLFFTGIQFFYFFLKIIEGVCLCIVFLHTDENICGRKNIRRTRKHQNKYLVTTWPSSLLSISMCIPVQEFFFHTLHFTFFLNFLHFSLIIIITFLYFLKFYISLNIFKSFSFLIIKFIFYFFLFSFILKNFLHTRIIYLFYVKLSREYTKMLQKQNIFIDVQS